MRHGQAHPGWRHWLFLFKNPDRPHKSSMVAQSGSSSPTLVLQVLCAVLATKKGPAEVGHFSRGDPKYAKLELACGVPAWMERSAGFRMTPLDLRSFTRGGAGPRGFA
jgi:hypothetical protein